MSSSPQTDKPLWRSPSGWSLRARIVATMIALLALLGTAVGAGAEIFLHKTLYDQLDARLDQAIYGPGGGGFPRPVPDSVPPPGLAAGSIVLKIRPDTVTGGYITSFLDSRDQVAQGYVTLTDDQLGPLYDLKVDGAKTDVEIPGHGAYRASAVLVDGRGGSLIQVTALSLRATDDTLVRVAMFIGGALLVMLVVAGWAGAVIVRRTLRPLDRVAATATRVAELPLDSGEVRLAQRVPEADTDPRTEVGQVGAALNRMLDHVGSALAARHASETQVRQFVADASHELRTPLAAIRGYAELSRRSRTPVPEDVAHVLSRVESEAQRMTGLVEDLLLLARLDAGRPLAHDPVDLTMLVVDTVSDAHAAGPAHHWHLDLPDEPVQVHGDGARLHQVLANLLANARAHTPEGTNVTVGVSDGPEGAVLRVTDEGPGIPPELLPHIFERFARGDSSRSRAAGSTGLGLSIVHAVVTAHGGTVSVASVPGRTEFTVVLPVRQPG